MLSDEIPDLFSDMLGNKDDTDVFSISELLECGLDLTKSRVLVNNQEVSLALSVPLANASEQEP